MHYTLPFNVLSESLSFPPSLLWLSPTTGVMRRSLFVVTAASELAPLKWKLHVLCFLQTSLKYAFVQSQGLVLIL